MYICKYSLITKHTGDFNTSGGWKQTISPFTSTHTGWLKYIVGVIVVEGILARRIIIIYWHALKTINCTTCKYNIWPIQTTRSKWRSKQLTVFKIIEQKEENYKTKWARTTHYKLRENDFGSTNDSRRHVLEKYRFTIAWKQINNLAISANGTFYIVFICNLNKSITRW